MLTKCVADCLRELEENKTSTSALVRGAEERVGDEPLQGVELDGEPAAVCSQHRQHEGLPLLLVHTHSFPVRSELQVTQLPQLINILSSSSRVLRQLTRRENRATNRVRT